MIVGGGRPTGRRASKVRTNLGEKEMTRRIYPVLVVALAVMVGCGALNPFEKVEKGLRGEGPGKPTWAKKYDDKTCRSWRSDLNPRSKAKVAKEMLTFLRIKDVASLHEARNPDEALINEFRAEVARVCQMLLANSPLKQAAEHAYVGKPQFRPPIP
jgi:hypothetical protein